MKRALAILLVGLTACTTTTASSAGLVVTDIDVINNHLWVKQCDLGMNVETNHGANAAIATLTILAILGGGGGASGGSSKSVDLSLTGCREHQAGAR